MTKLFDSRWTLLCKVLAADYLNETSQQLNVFALYITVRLDNWNTRPAFPITFLLPPHHYGE